MIEWDRVRAHSDPRINALNHIALRQRLREYAERPAPELDMRLEQLEKEGDTERVLEANAAIVAFTGVMLSMLRSAAWSWLPATAMAFLLQHAIQGWCPPLALFRRGGFRTRKEIDEEKYGLKLLRGDFEGFPSRDGVPPQARAYAAWEALQAGR